MVSFEMVHLVNSKSRSLGGFAKWIWNGHSVSNTNRGSSRLLWLMNHLLFCSFAPHLVARTERNELQVSKLLHHSVLTELERE